MLPLAVALALAAPVPKLPPCPLRTDPLPDEYKLADLADAVPGGEKGTVELLAWERIEDDRPHTVTQVLVLKKFDKADEKGRTCQLTKLLRHPKDKDWQHEFINPPQIVIPPEFNPFTSDAYWMRSQGYDKPPTDEELMAFIHDSYWTPELGRVHSGRNKFCTTKLAGGGVNRDAWRTHFDREPPADLFPELKKDDK